MPTLAVDDSIEPGSSGLRKPAAAPSTRHDALEDGHCIQNAVLRAHLLAERSGSVPHRGGSGEVESAPECLRLGPPAIHVAGATPARRKRSAQENWSPANGVTVDGTPARAAEWDVPEPP